MARPTAPLVLALTVCTFGLLVLGAAALPEQPLAVTDQDLLPADLDTAAAVRPARARRGGRRAPDACHAGCEFSSLGSADLHAYHHDDTGVLHVLYLEARWTKPQLRRLRARAGAWRQTVTVQLPHAEGHRTVALDHWASDLPAARVEAVAANAAAVTFTATTPKPGRLRAGRLYRTQVLVRSSYDLDGAVWHYSEQIAHSPPGGSDGRFRAAVSSMPRRGVGGWCSRCYVIWDVDSAEAR